MVHRVRHHRSQKLIESEILEYVSAYVASFESTYRRVSYEYYTIDNVETYLAVLCEGISSLGYW